MSDFLISSAANTVEWLLSKCCPQPPAGTLSNHTRHLRVTLDVEEWLSTNSHPANKSPLNSLPALSSPFWGFLNPWKVMLSSFITGADVHGGLGGRSPAETHACNWWVWPAPDKVMAKQHNRTWREGSWWTSCAILVLLTLTLKENRPPL